jgi:hypothetical protein
MPLPWMQYQPANRAIMDIKSLKSMISYSHPLISELLHVQSWTDQGIRFSLLNFSLKIHLKVQLTGSNDALTGNGQALNRRSRKRLRPTSKQIIVSLAAVCI